MAIANQRLPDPATAMATKNTPSHAADRPAADGSTFDPDLCLHELVAAQVRRTPDAAALVDDDAQLTYRELEDRAALLAQLLRIKGVGADTLVGVCVERGFDLIVALLGVLKAGGAFVPLDPGYPSARLALMVEDAQLALIVTHSALAERLPASGAERIRLDSDLDLVRTGSEAPGPEPARVADPNSLAYVMYTSGSTGQPKGVMVPHRAVVNYVGWMAHAFALDARHRFVLKTPIAFDIAVWEVFLPLTRGATLVMMAPGGHVDPEALVATIRRHAITVLQVVPAQLKQLLETRSLDTCTTLTHVFSAGEALPRALVTGCLARLPVRLHNMYGPTETCIASTSHTCTTAEAGEATVSIGLPIARTEVYVLDEAGDTVGDGTAGEIYIGGLGMARGYWRRPELTAERFVPNPFDQTPGARLYRTGDRGRWRNDGTLEFLGRIDHQVKLRGFRIELGEVEAALARHGSIRDAVVLLRTDPSGEGALVAYLVFRNGAAIVRETLIAHLRSTLPDHMVPSDFVVVDAMPLMPNGKVDRKAVSTLTGRTLESAVLLVRPSTEAEIALARLWMDVLGVEDVGVHDNFFDLGGHSLSATRLLMRAGEHFQIELPLRDLFECPTVARLSARIAARRLSGGRAVVPFRRAERVDGASHPLSFAQRRLWLLEQLEPEAAYLTADAVLVKGRLDVEALRRSFETVVHRHEALRTSFVVIDDMPRQVVRAPGVFDLVVVEVTGSTVEVRRTDAARRAADDADRRFDLTRDCLLRATLYRLASDEHLMLVTQHHIASDGWSGEVLWRELDVVYAALSSGQTWRLPNLPLQYADFTAWQRAWLEGDRFDRQLQYWRRHLAGLEPLELPADRERPPQPSYRGGHYRFRVDRERMSRLRALSRQQSATIFMTLLAAFQLQLSRHCRRSDVAVGTPIANRQHPDLADLIGFFVNTLVLRTDLRGAMSFRDLIDRVRRVALDAYGHQDLPFERIVEELKPKRDLSRNPLVQVLFALDNTKNTKPSLQGLDVTPVAAGRPYVRFDLECHVTESADGGLDVLLAYATDLFEPDTIERFGQSFESLLATVVAEPDAPVTLPDETGSAARLLPVVAAPVAVRSEAVNSGTSRLVVDLVEAQAQLTPDRVAIVAGDRQLTYRALAAQASSVACALRTRGVGRGDLVALCLDRSIDTFVAVLGVLEAGAACVPLDPSHPAQRLAVILRDARPVALMTRTALRDRVGPFDGVVIDLDAGWIEDGEGASTDDRPEIVQEDLAYVLYTSGSTGAPKGVAMPHRALANLVQWHARHERLGAAARTLQFASLTFDVAFQELFTTWATGGALVVIDDDQRRDPAELFRVLVEQRVERLFVPYVALRMLADVAASLGGPPRLKDIVSAGETLRLPPAVSAFVRAIPGCRLHNQYGPTETHVVTTFVLPEDVTEWPSTCPIGRPIDHVHILVVDEALQPVPTGVTGEICVAGAALARGYLHRPDLTAERFVPHPEVDGGVIYRTGDLGHWRADGVLEFLGRADHQVKIRGYRVELEEVEAALAAHPGVRACAVTMSQADSSGALAAFVVASDAAPTRGELVRHLRARLPEYMVPARFAMLDALPLNANGKVDRAALPTVASGRTTLGAEPIATLTDTERLIARIWCESLNATHVDRHDNFFEVGGHSFLAAQVVGRLRTVFQIEMPLRTIFVKPTVAQLAEVVDAQTPRRSPPPTVEPRPPFPTAAMTPGPAPLSFAQRGLWFIEQLQHGTAAYNLPRAIRLRGALDVGILERSIDAVVQRHAALRTTFEVIDDEPRQVVQAGLHPRMTFVDLAGSPRTEQDATLERLVAEEGAKAFDLACDCLLRAVVFRLSEEDHLLMLTMHHIAADGWSVSLLRSELAAHYNAWTARAEPVLPPLPVQYPEFAAWQHESLEGSKLTAHLEHWRTRLQNLTPLELPLDRPRPMLPSYRGNSRAVTIDAATVARLRTIGQQEQATLFMTLLSGFYVLLSRYTGQDDIAVGVPAANRPAAELERVIGLFVNTLVLRADLAASPSFRQLVSQVRDVALDAYEHQDAPFDKLVEYLHPQPDLRRNPLVQVVFGLQNVPDQDTALAGIDSRVVLLVEECVRFDLELHMQEIEDGSVEGNFVYSTALFDASTIDRMAAHLHLLLQAVAASPDVALTTMTMLGEAERRQLLVDWNVTGAADPAAPVHRLFEAQAARTPEAVAVVWRDRTLTYGELNRRANRLARHLGSLGVGVGALVGVAIDRSLEALVVLLGVLKAGAAYFPLHPRDPAARWAQLLADSGALALVVGASLEVAVAAAVPSVVNVVEEADLIARQNDTDLEVEVGPDDLAYVMYTSGSTGRPKGVEIPHRGIVRLVCANVVPLTPADTVLQLAPLAFDASTFEIWSPLLTGARLVVYPEAELDLAGLEDVLREERISHLWLTASLFNTVVEDRPHALRTLRWLISGGEVLSVSHVSRALEMHPSLRMLNGYGPTEVTTFACVYPIERSTLSARQSIPIGRPIRNTTAYVLDAHRRPVPIGVPGTLYLGGAGLALGYRHRPDLTAERFVANPFVEGERLYDTGDRVRYLADGTIEFLGRTDDQIKLRGFRIELGEIEETLGTHPQVRSAIVRLREDPAGSRRLVAYIVGRDTCELAEVRSFLAQQLPNYMVPEAFVPLSALPLNANGKIDPEALPPPPAAAAVQARTFVAPRGNVELHLVKIWEDLLKRRPVGVRDNFFDLGGHSLLAAQLFDRIERVFHRRLLLDTLWFDGGTIEAIARALRDEANSAPELVVMKKGSRRPLFVVHTRGGHLFHYDDLVRQLRVDQAVYGLQARGVYGAAVPARTVADIASHCIESMRQVQPTGPYLLAGFSSGGVVAFEVAQQLTAAGEDVALLALLDTYAPRVGTRWLLDELADVRQSHEMRSALRELSRYLISRVPGAGRRIEPRSVQEAHRWAHWSYRPRRYTEAIDLVVADDSARIAGADLLGWKRLAASELRMHRLPGSHGGLVKTPIVAELAALLESRIDAIGA